MTTPDFIAWLDAKMEQHGAVVTERILRDARIEEQVKEALRSLTVPGDVELRAGVVAWLQGHRDSAWREYIDGLARSSADRRPSLR